MLKANQARVWFGSPLEPEPDQTKQANGCGEEDTSGTYAKHQHGGGGGGRSGL